MGLKIHENVIPRLRAVSGQGDVLLCSNSR